MVRVVGYGCGGGGAEVEVSFPRKEPFPPASGEAEREGVSEGAGLSDNAGVGEREDGRGICEGVAVPVPVVVEAGGGARAVPVCFDNFLGLKAYADLSFFGICGEGGSEAGVSETFGRPECGPRRFRMEEKCSQSW